MDRYFVCVYAISKNESAFVERWMQSMSEADAVVVLDTGSTDDTVEKLRERGATVVQEDSIKMLVLFIGSSNSVCMLSCSVMSDSL